MKYHAAQLLLQLRQIVPIERTISRVDFPDRLSAETDALHLAASFGPRLLRHTIRKTSSRPGATYTLRYTVTETTEFPLF